MLKGGWLKGNPVALVKKPEAPIDPMIRRLLPPEGIALAFEVIAATRNPLKRARDHFMFSLFYLTGLRTFEATAVDMGTVRRSTSGNLWLMVHGKRNKRREVPISEALYEELGRYRVAFGLPPGHTARRRYALADGRQQQAQKDQQQHRPQGHDRDHGTRR